MHSPNEYHHLKVFPAPVPSALRLFGVFMFIPSSHQLVEQLIARHRLQESGFHGPFDAAAGEVVVFDVDPLQEFQVDAWIRGLEGVHQLEEGAVPGAVDGPSFLRAAAVDIGVNRHVRDEGLGGRDPLQVAGDGGEAAVVLVQPGFHVRPHQQAVEPGVVVVDQSVAGAVIGLQHVFEIDFHVFPPLYLSTNYTNSHELNRTLMTRIISLCLCVSVFCLFFPSYSLRVSLLPASRSVPIEPLGSQREVNGTWMGSKPGSPYI